MTGQDYIDRAKNAYYPVETYVNSSVLATFVNFARLKVIKFAKLGYREIAIDLSQGQGTYTITPPLLELYRVLISLDGTVRYEILPVPLGHYPFAATAFQAPPSAFCFIPPNKLTVYPTPDKSYEASLYGVRTPSVNYTSANLMVEDLDITVETFLDPVSILVAAQIARFDQNYELAMHLEELFVMSFAAARV